MPGGEVGDEDLAPVQAIRPLALPAPSAARDVDEWFGAAIAPAEVHAVRASAHAAAAIGHRALMSFLLVSAGSWERLLGSAWPARPGESS